MSVRIHSVSVVLWAMATKEGDLIEQVTRTVVVDSLKGAVEYVSSFRDREVQSYSIKSEWS